MENAMLIAIMLSLSSIVAGQIFLIFIDLPNSTNSNPQELHEKIATIKYSARWWHDQLEDYSLQKVVVLLNRAERQGLIKKENSGYGDYKIYIPCKSLDKNKKEKEEKIFDFFIKNA